MSSFTIKDINEIVKCHINSLELIENKILIRLTGQIRSIKKYGSMFIYDLCENHNKIKCKSFNVDIEENKIYNITGIVNNGKYGIEFYCRKVEIIVDKKSDTNKLFDLCIDKKYFEKKKEIDFLNLKNITILSKKNTQGYQDFINQLKIPININCIPVCLEGSNTSQDIINKINKLQDVDTDIIMIIRGGGSVTDISLSFDKIELFETIINSYIPIVTSIGHYDDCDKKLLITKVSDKDFSTPTTASNYINNLFINKLKNNYNIYKNNLINIFSKKLEECDVIYDDEYDELYNDVCNDIDNLKNIIKKNLLNIKLINDPGKEFLIKRNGKFYKCELNIKEEVNYDEEELKYIEEININNLPTIKKYDFIKEELKQIRKKKKNIKCFEKNYDDIKEENNLEIEKNLEIENNIKNLKINNKNYKKIKHKILFYLKEINSLEDYNLEEENKEENKEEKYEEEEFYNLLNKNFDINVYKKKLLLSFQKYF